PRLPRRPRLRHRAPPAGRAGLRGRARVRHRSRAGDALAAAGPPRPRARLDEPRARGRARDRPAPGRRDARALGLGLDVPLPRAPVPRARGPGPEPGAPAPRRHAGRRPPAARARARDRRRRAAAGAAGRAARVPLQLRPVRGVAARAVLPGGHARPVAHGGRPRLRAHAARQRAGRAARRLGHGSGGPARAARVRARARGCGPPPDRDAHRGHTARAGGPGPGPGRPRGRPVPGADPGPADGVVSPRAAGGGGRPRVPLPHARQRARRAGHRRALRGAARARGLPARLPRRVRGRGRGVRGGGGAGDPARRPGACDRSGRLRSMTAPPRTYRWVILSVCVLGFMQTHVQRVGFAPLIPTFIEDMRLSYAAAGTIMAAYFWSYALMQVPIGMLTDRLGARRVMLGCMGVLAVGALAFALAGSFAQSLLARVVVGAGAAATWLPGLRLIHEWFPLRERGLATGLFSAGGGVGATAALLLLPVLAGHLGWRLGYGLLAVPVLVTMGAVWLLVGPDPRPHGGAAMPGGFARSMLEVLGTPALWPFNVYVLFSYGGYFALLTWLPTFLVRSEG